MDPRILEVHLTTRGISFCAKKEFYSSELTHEEYLISLLQKFFPRFQDLTTDFLTSLPAEIRVLYLSFLNKMIFHRLEVLKSVGRRILSDAEFAIFYGMCDAVSNAKRNASQNSLKLGYNDLQVELAALVQAFQTLSGLMYPEHR